MAISARTGPAPHPRLPASRLETRERNYAPPVPRVNNRGGSQRRAADIPDLFEDLPSRPAKNSRVATLYKSRRTTDRAARPHSRTIATTAGPPDSRSTGNNRTDLPKSGIASLPDPVQTRGSDRRTASWEARAVQPFHAALQTPDASRARYTSTEALRATMRAAAGFRPYRRSRRQDHPPTGRTNTRYKNPDAASSAAETSPRGSSRSDASPASACTARLQPAYNGDQAPPEIAQTLWGEEARQGMIAVFMWPLWLMRCRITSSRLESGSTLLTKSLDAMSPWLTISSDRCICAGVWWKLALHVSSE